jgi:hypothetical protein
MSGGIKDPDSVFLSPDDFAMREGERMCPRCGCCSVGVASYDPTDRASLPRIVEMRFIPEVASLLPEPSGNGDEAWFCKGGCNRKGEHPKTRGRMKADWPLPSLIGRVKKVR